MRFDRNRRKKGKTPKLVSQLAEMLRRIKERNDSIEKSRKLAKQKKKKATTSDYSAIPEAMKREIRDFLKYQMFTPDMVSQNIAIFEQARAI